MNIWSSKGQLKRVTTLILAGLLLLPQNITTPAAEFDSEHTTVDEPICEDIIPQKDVIEEISDETALQEDAIEEISDETALQEDAIEAISDETALQEDAIEEISDETALQEDAIEEISDETALQEDAIEAISDETALQEDAIEAISEEIAPQEDAIEEISDEIAPQEDAIEEISEESAPQEEGIEEIIEADNSDEQSVDIAGSSQAESEDSKFADLDAYEEDTYLSEYLALKYPALNTSDNYTNKRGKSCLTLSERIAANIDTIEIGNDTGSDEKSVQLRELCQNMVNFRPLGTLAKVKKIKIYGQDIRGIYLPSYEGLQKYQIPGLDKVNLETLIIENSTFNLYTIGGAFSESEVNCGALGTRGCATLKNVEFNNVTIGSHYKGDDEHYLYSYVFHILNATNLERFILNVNLSEPEQEFVIDAGNTAFNSLTNANCNISSVETGRIVIKSSNSDSYFSKNWSQYIITEPDFYSNYFRNYLVYCTDIDTNHDKIVTQAEFDAVENLTITYGENFQSYMDAMHDLRDVEKFTNLKTLTIERNVIRDGSYFNDVAFPQNDKLTSITIHNNGTEFPADFILEIPSSVENFEYTNNAAKDKSSSNSFANIKINDSGKLMSVRLDYSNVKNIEINNATSNKRVLEQLSAMECSKLEQITLGGSGYTLSGSVTLNDSNKLTKIGKANTGDSTKWTVYLDSNTLLNISNCTNFGTATSNIEINTGNKTAGIVAYAVNGLSSNESEPHTLSINENATGQSYITLRYDDDNAWWKTYAESIGATSEKGASIPNIAVFAHGNHLRNSAKSDGWTPYERWVDQYDIELGITDDVHFFTNSVVYYVEEEIAGQKTLRKLPAADSSNVTFESSDTSLYIIEDTTFGGDPDGKLSPYIYGKRPGRAKITAYWNYKDESGKVTETVPIGEANVLSASPANGIEFSINSSVQSGDGSKENPIYVEKGTGRLSLSAKNKYANEDFLYTDKDSIRWMIYDANDIKEKEYSMRGEATNAGVSVVSDSYSEESPVRKNTRVFKFTGNDNDFFKFTAQVPLSRYYNGNSNWGGFINQSCYVKVVDPCQISVSNRDMVYGDTTRDYSTITVTNGKDCDISIKDAKKYGDYFEVERVKPDENDTSVWKLSIRSNGVDSDVIKKVIDNNKTITLIINANGTRHEETINLINKESEPIEEEKEEEKEEKNGMYPDLEIDPETNNGWGDIIYDDKYIIDPSKITEDTISVVGISDVTYTGSAQTFDLRVYKGTTLLKEGTDYTVKYANNKNAWEGPETCGSDKPEKQPCVIITGKGSYKSLFEDYTKNYSDKLKFKIYRINIEDNEDVYVSNESAIFKNNKKYTPTPLVILNGNKLKKNTDYTLTYLSDDGELAQFSKPGTYKIRVTGCGKYKGTLVSTYYLKEGEGAVLMTQASIKGMNTSLPYTGAAITAAELMKSDFGVKVKVNGNNVELIKDKDYEIILKDNTDVGTGIMIIAAKEGNDNNLVGEKLVKFKINGNAISKTTIMLKADESDVKATNSYTYTGNKIKPIVYVSTKGSSPLRLQENKDYTIEYQKNVNVGTAKIYIRGINAYTGTVRKNFKIIPVDFAINSIADDSGVSVIHAQQEGDAYKIGNTNKLKCAVKVTFNNKVLIEGRDYSLTFKNNSENSKKAPEVIIRGKGNFKNSFKLPVTLF